MSNDKEFEKKLAGYEKAEAAYNTAKSELEVVLKDRLGQLVNVNGKPHRVAKRDINVKNAAGEKVKTGETYFLRCCVSDEILQAIRG